MNIHTYLSWSWLKITLQSFVLVGMCNNWITDSPKTLLFTVSSKSNYKWRASGARVCNSSYGRWEILSSLELLGSCGKKLRSENSNSYGPGWQHTLVLALRTMVTCIISVTIVVNPVLFRCFLRSHICRECVSSSLRWPRLFLRNVLNWVT